MITEIDVKKFQKINKQCDVMGVVRTLYPNIEIEIETTLNKKKKKKV